MSCSHVFILCDVNSLLPLNIFQQRLAWLSALAMLSHCQISPWRCDDKVLVYLLFTIIIVSFFVQKINEQPLERAPGPQRRMMGTCLALAQFIYLSDHWKRVLWLLRNLYRQWIPYVSQYWEYFTVLYVDKELYITSRILKLFLIACNINHQNETRDKREGDSQANVIKISSKKETEWERAQN